MLSENIIVSNTDALTFFSDLYDSIQDPVCIFDLDGQVSYCNEAFSIVTGISQIRLLNKKTTFYNCFKSVDDLPFDSKKVIELSQIGGISILKYETKKVMRGLGQFSIKKVNLPGFENLLQFNFKDLTIEEDLVRSFRFELASRNKKIDEMNQLLEIFQKIRLLDEPSMIIKEFMNYLLSSTQFIAAASRINNKMEIIYTLKDSEGHSVVESRPSFEELKKEIENHISTTVVSKYQTHRSSVPNATDYYCWSIVPFKLATSELHAIFIFDSFEQLNRFSHQSAIILSEQLNLILNNLTLKELSYTDGLTKLRNNLFFRKNIEDICSKNQEVQLILFDVDFFKKINDTFGHPGGDAVLMFLGEKIPQIMQKTNPDHSLATIARVGGEEFAILIPGKSLSFAQEFAEILRSEIEEASVAFNDIQIKFTISLGLSSWDLSQFGYSPEAVKKLYKTADDALYNSKRTGRNKVSVLNVA